MRFCRLLGVFAVLVIMVSAGPLSACASGGTTIGPVPISVLGHPRLCWQAGGNGSAVTLEHCDRMLQGQRWSLTPDGVLMNGNGYCLEAVPGRPLLVDFASQCAGTPSQTRHYRSGQLISPVTGTGTTQRSRTARTSASLTVTVAPAAPRPRSPLPLIAGAAVLLLLAGGILLLATRTPVATFSPAATGASAAAHTLPATPMPPHPLDDPPTGPQTPIS